MLQASLAEEVVLFTDLDRVDELMCTSVLCACIDSVKLVLFSTKHAEKTDSRKDGSVNATETMSNKAELPKGETMGNLQFARVHLQLRRLQQQVDITQLSILSAIPEHQSNVLFTLKNWSSDESLPESLDVNEQFIMFECGVNDISLKMTHRSGYGNDGIGDEMARDPAKSSMKDEPTKGTSATAGVSRPLKPVIKKPPTSNTMTVPSKQEDCLTNDSKDVTSCVFPWQRNTSSSLLDVNAIWFSFASPPAKKVPQSMRYRITPV